MNFTPLLSKLCIILLISSCSVYRDAPINLKEENTAWEKESHIPFHTSVSQKQAILIGLIMNPELNKARLKLATSKEVAKQAGWWNDPSFSWEIEKVLQENIINLSANLGLTIPVTGIPYLEKKVAEQYKEADFWTLRQAELDFLCSLDQAWNKLSITQRRKTLIQERLNSISQENSQMKQLLEAGEIDFSSWQIAMQRMNNATRELQTITGAETEQQLELIKLMGLHPSTIKNLKFNINLGEQTPPAVLIPTPAELTKMPKIKAQLAIYATTETQLKTEIRRQYPELELGPTFTRDDGEKEVGGDIVFNIPLWNRNRKAISEARGSRNIARQETIQLWKTELTNAQRLSTVQQITLQQCNAELQRIPPLVEAIKTIEKLYKIGETSLAELAENRHQLYENRLAFLDKLDALLSIQAQMRYLTHAPFQTK